ncbi:MAG: PAS domain-containing protein [Gammaproteobacteria bacterium]|nr:PAS domain-containing protein [Gammaproteobacteria bacterium]
MSKAEFNNKNLQILRERAELAMTKKSKSIEERSQLSWEETQRLLHELDVYRVELEMQNEELRKTQEELEEALDKYTDLYDYAPVGYLIVQSYGIISSANITAGIILGESRADLVGTSIQTYIAKQSQDEFYKLRRAVERKAGIQSCEIMMKRKGDASFRSRVDCIAVPGEDGSTACRVAFCGTNPVTF